MKPILKVSLSFEKYSSGTLLIFVNGVLEGFLTNAKYPTPTPNYAALELLRNEFSIAVVNGGIHLNNIKRDKRQLLINALRMWANYVNINNYNYDRTIMETTGFKINGGKYTRREIPGNITRLTLERGKLYGTLKATAKVVDQSDYYLPRFRVIGDLDNSDWCYLSPSSSSRMLITGLPKGAIVEVQVCANNTKGSGNWSAIYEFDFGR